MNFFMGIFFGCVAGAVVSSIINYWLWNTYTKDEQLGKKVFSSFFAFYCGGLFGLVGTAPLLLAMWFIASRYKKRRTRFGDLVIIKEDLDLYGKNAA